MWLRACVCVRLPGDAPYRVKKHPLPAMREGVLLLFDLDDYPIDAPAEIKNLVGVTVPKTPLRDIGQSPGIISLHEQFAPRWQGGDGLCGAHERHGADLSDEVQDRTGYHDDSPFRSHQRISKYTAPSMTACRAMAAGHPKAAGRKTGALEPRRASHQP